MEFRNVKLINISLAILCLCLESYVYQQSHLLARVDQIYLGVVSFCLLESIISILLCANRTVVDSVIRGVACGCSFALMLVGGLLVYSAVQIENSDDCELVETIAYQCHKYEYKICSGMLAIMNGILYLMVKSSSSNIPGTIHVTATTITTSNNVQGGGILHQPPPPYPFSNAYVTDSVLLPPPPYHSIQHNNNTSVYPSNQFSYATHLQPQLQQQPMAQQITREQTKET